MTIEEERLHKNFWLDFEKDIIDLNNKVNKRINELPINVQKAIFTEKSNLIEKITTYLYIQEKNKRNAII